MCMCQHLLMPVNTLNIKKIFIHIYKLIQSLELLVFHLPVASVDAVQWNCPPAPFPHLDGYLDKIPCLSYAETCA